MSPSSLHETCVKTIRFLAADAIERGACGLKDPNRAPDVTLLAIGLKRHFLLDAAGVPKVAVEAGMTRGWHYLVGDDGAVIGLDFTVDHVVDAATAVLEGTAHPAVSTP